jgi:hypothetical protein
MMAAWFMLADLDAIGRGLDLAERSALLGAGTKIEGVLMARPTSHPQEDAILGRRARFLSAGGQDVQPVGGRESENAGRGEFHQFAA